MYKSEPEVMKVLTDNFTDSEIRDVAKEIMDETFFQVAYDPQSLSGRMIFKFWEAGFKGINCQTIVRNAVVNYALKEFLEPSGGFFVKALEESTLFKNYNVGETAKIEACAREDKDFLIGIAKRHGFEMLSRALYTRGFNAGKRSTETPKEFHL